MEIVGASPPDVDICVSDVLLVSDCDEGVSLNEHLSPFAKSVPFP
jgi:hypothetical protein